MEHVRYKEMHVLPLGEKERRYTFAKSHTGKINQKLREIRGKENRSEGMGLKQQCTLTFETHKCFIRENIKVIS